MKTFSLAIAIALFTAPSLFTQDLAGFHSTLTTDCRNIRGHASRIVAEASASELNKEVAQAHLAQVAKYHDQMDLTLKQSKKSLSAQQLKAVVAEYESLEKTCAAIGEFVRKLQAELAKDDPDRMSVREIASKLRTQMSAGYDVHERLKKKLGLS